MIALDAMGGDFAPRETVLGAIRAAQKGISIALFGDEKKLIPLLNEFDNQWHQLPLVIFHCTQSIDMGAIPSVSVMKQHDSSLVRALHAVASGQAQALVTAGNSGAALVAGSLILGKVDGLERPVLGEFLPTEHGSLFCLDLGANTDCKAHYLYQFALLGNAYVGLQKKIANPRIALLPNGTEPYKGSQAVKQAYTLLEHSSLNFVGNVEARDIFTAPVDVLVCDGFAGNVLLKAVQGTIAAAKRLLTREIRQMSWWQKLLLAGNKKMLEKAFKNSDHHRVGGALLLGLNYPLFIAHGCATAVSIESALLKAHHLVKQQFITSFNNRIVHDLYEPNNPSIPEKQYRNQI